MCYKRLGIASDAVCFIYRMFENKGQVKKMALTVKITSRKNKEVKFAAEIASSAKSRQENNMFFVEGARLCDDAAKSSVKILKLFYTESAMNKYQKYLVNAAAIAEEVFEIDEHVVSLLAQTKNSQGVFCLCEMLNKKAIAEISGKWAVLENIQDPSNLGTIMRTAEALAVSGLILIAGCDSFSPKAVRASMGAVFRMQILTVSNLDELSKISGINKMESLAAVPNSSAEKLGEINLSDNILLFIGNEGNGLSEQAVNFCKRKITIPMAGRAESLNAAAAAAICLWEITKP